MKYKCKKFMKKRYVSNYYYFLKYSLINNFKKKMFNIFNLER